MLDRPQTYSELAPRLHAAGYAVLPLDNKAPKVPKWSELAITQQQVAQWAAEKPEANIGLRCDQALMVDLDIEDWAEAQRMTDLILDQFPGGLIRRRGDKAKLALLYRRADPDGAYKNQGQKRYCHASGGVVELFDNSGAQMGIYSSGLPGGDYRWDGSSPLDVPFDELAPLSLHQWDALRELLTQQGYVARSGSRTKQTAPTPRTDGPTEPDLSAGWNNEVFAMIGKRVRSGIDDVVVETEALTWRLPGYSEQETLAEVRDMITRWRAYLEESPDESYEDWRNGWVFDASSNKFWFLETMSSINQQAWRTVNGHRRSTLTDEDGETQTIPYCKRWLTDADAVRVNGTTIAPEQGLITKDNRLNLWRDYWARLHADEGEPDGSEGVELFKELVDFLCDGRDEIIDMLLNWIGFGLFNPAIRVRWSILLISDLKGAGKSMLCSTIARLYGFENASILPGLGGLLSNFNGSILEGKAFVAVNETVDKGDGSKFGAVEALKSFISDDQISVEHKGQDRRQVDNYARFMFCSNHTDGLPFEKNERRFGVIVCQATQALDPAFYARFAEIFEDDQALADVAAWLKAHYSDPLPNTAPPSDTALIQDELVEDWVAMLNDHVDDTRMYPVALPAKDMRELADRLSGRKLSDNHRAKVLKRGGWTRGKFKGRRCYWRGDQQPDYLDEDLKYEL